MDIVSRPTENHKEWHFTVQDHTIPGTVLHVTYQVCRSARALSSQCAYTVQPVSEAEVTTGGTFRIIGAPVTGKDGEKRFACVWLGPLGNDMREYQFTRVLLAQARLNAPEH